MAIPVEDKDIDGTIFRVSGLDLRTERAAFVLLMKRLGPAVLSFVQGGKDPVLGMAKLLEVVENDDLDYLIGIFMKVTEIQLDTQRPDKAWVPAMEGAFKKGLSSQLKWLWFCLEHQFIPFLGEDVSTFLQAAVAKASALSSPQT